MSVRETTKETSSTQLVVGIIEQLNISSTIAEVMKITEDVKRAQEVEKTIDNIINTFITSGQAEWLRYAWTPPRDLIEMSKSKLTTIFNELKTNMWNSLVNSAGGLRITSSYYSHKGRIQSQLYGLDFWVDVHSGILKDIALKRVERYYNKLLGWNYPSVETAFRLYCKGLISLEECKEYVTSMAGYTSDLFYKLLEDYYRELPIETAFRLYKRGVITRKDFIEICKRNCYKEEDAYLLEKALEYVPSFYDLLRLADFVPLDTLYITAILRANGVREADIPYLTTLIQLRPLREERRSVVGRLMYEYAHGYITKEYFLKQLDELRFLPQEKALYEFWADRQKEDYLMELKLDIVEQKVRKGAYADREAIVKDLKALGLEEEVANLLAEKWFWQYMVK